MREHFTSGFLILILLSGFSAGAQISPGTLAAVHSSLEGMSNCTKCHELGNKVTNSKCLACHIELKARVDQNKGYHSSPEIKGKNCTGCHNDHHGLNFQILRFDKDKFNHNLTGYALTGAHAKKTCKDCHKPEFISNKAIKAKKLTYLGLGTECLACHADYHQQTLSANCTNCHSADAFKPVTKFDHASTKYPLAGKHQSVECIKCHPIITKNGTKFQEFAGIHFQNCTNCHVDVHQNKFGQECKQCHSEVSFMIIKANNNFDHSKTNFKLEDKHLVVPCTACHGSNVNAPLKHDKCTDCHKDYHDRQFMNDGMVTNCADCHSTKGYTQTSFSVDRHNQGKFILEGAHVTTPCAKCHKKTEKWSFREIGTICTDCHKDYHNGQFTRDGKVTNCAICHNSKGFDQIAYTVDQHNKGRFRLEGGHLATPCFECHKKTGSWSFREIGIRCVDCHKDIHVDQIDKKYYPESNCSVCHKPSRWSDIGFDHSPTGFTLAGKHAAIACSACHYKPDSSGRTIQKFAHMSQTCTDCHPDTHFKQFEVNGLTSCVKCHTFENWNIPNFDHNTTAFKLDGKHQNVACAKCHKKITNNNNTYVLYKIKEWKCENCH
jgi:nitrate/TMAO reductase-like tetraheme cytochrome c subunit